MYFAFFSYLCRGMMQHKHRIISLLLLLTIGFYLGGSTLFIHSHTIGGVKVVHSHPFSGTPASHTHSDSSLQTISRLLNPDGITAEGIAVECCEMHITKEHSILQGGDCTDAVLTYGLLRAPPALV